MTSPPPTSLGGLVRHLGPGFIITATIVGSGELIVTPKLGASVGFSLLWFIIVGCVAEGVRADPARTHRRGHRPHHARRAQRVARPALAGVVDSLAVAGDVRLAGLPGQRHRRRHRRRLRRAGHRRWAASLGACPWACRARCCWPADATASSSAARRGWWRAFTRVGGRFGRRPAVHALSHHRPRSCGAACSSRCPTASRSRLPPLA